LNKIGTTLKVTFGQFLHQGTCAYRFKGPKNNIVIEEVKCGAGVKSQHSDEIVLLAGEMSGKFKNFTE